MSHSDGMALAAPRQIAVPGRNCWRIAPAARAAFLIDASAYFAAFAQAVEQAQRSIFIMAWDIHSRTRLRPDQPPGQYPDELGPFLDALVRERRDLHVYILNWDCNIIYAFEREALPGVQLGWKTHQRIQFRLDSNYPVGASLHQKIIVVDDAIAFSGGLDLTIRRWDTPAHLAQYPGRIDHRGVPYPPFHDIQLLVDGSAARALAELVRERWFRRTGQRIPPTPVDTDPWPGAVQPDMTDNEWFFLAHTLRHLGAHFGQASKARTWPSWQPLFALDRIWVHPPEALAAVRVHISPTARGASDHLPLVGIIKVVRPEAHQ